MGICLLKIDWCIVCVGDGLKVFCVCNGRVRMNCLLAVIPERKQVLK